MLEIRRRPMQKCFILLQSCICYLKEQQCWRLSHSVLWNILILPWSHACTALLPELVILLQLLKLSVPLRPHLESGLFPLLSSLTQEYRGLVGWYTQTALSHKPGLSEILENSMTWQQYLNWQKGGVGESANGINRYKLSVIKLIVGK